MRKVIAVLMMMFVVVFFYSSLQKRQPQGKKETIDVIQDIMDKLEEEYPSNPVEITEIHNELINMLYGMELTDEETMKAIEAQRILYAEEFLILNPIENHILEIERENTMNDIKEIKVIGSKVMNSYNDPPGTLRVQVVHYTNKQDGDLVREYIVKEEKLPSSKKTPEKKTWKIFGWENVGVAKTQEEE